MHEHPYRALGVMASLSFVSMYILMYAMVDRFANVLNNVNQAYMAALMTAPMVLSELFMMRAMLPNRRLNAGIAAMALVAWIGAFALIRRQVAVGDEQFLRSMIPHHAGAILMCERAALDDPEIRGLCRRIVESQRSEIALMKAELGRLRSD